VFAILNSHIWHYLLTLNCCPDQLRVTLFSIISYTMAIKIFLWLFTAIENLYSPFTKIHLRFRFYLILLLYNTSVMSIIVPLSS